MLPHDGLAHLITAVPAAQLCRKARKHAGFHHPQDESGSVEAFFVPDGCMACEHCSPGEDDAGLPEAGCAFLQEEVTWDFEDDITDLFDVSVNKFNGFHEK